MFYIIHSNLGILGHESWPMILVKIDLFVKFVLDFRTKRFSTGGLTDVNRKELLAGALVFKIFLLQNLKQFSFLKLSFRGLIFVDFTKNGSEKTLTQEKD